MSKAEFKGKYFCASHTLEPEGPHVTLWEDHYENTAAITVLLSGKGTCFLENSSYLISGGDIVVMGMNESHSFHLDQNGPHERISLYFSSSILSPIWEYELPLMRIFTGHEPGSCNRYPPGSYDGEEAGRILTEICVLTDQLAKAPSDIGEARLHLLILRFLFLLYDSFERLKAAPAPQGGDPLIEKICHYIHENPEEHLSYEEIQKRFYVSRYYLTVLFRRHTGMTLTEYILQRRLLRVSSLIRQGCGIAAAAESAGFHNYSHFYKEFVKRKGMPPGEYYKIFKKQKGDF